MAALQWLVFHSSFLAKSGKPYLSPFSLNLAAGPGSSICAWSHEQQNTYSIYSTDSALKDLGLCQQGTKTHFEIFSAAAKGMKPWSAGCMLLLDAFSNNLSCKCVFPKFRWRKDPKLYLLHFPLCLQKLLFEEVGGCFGQPFWRY